MPIRLLVPELHYFVEGVFLGISRPVYIHIYLPYIPHIYLPGEEESKTALPDFILLQLLLVCKIFTKSKIFEKSQNLDLPPHWDPQFSHVKSHRKTAKSNTKTMGVGCPTACTMIQQFLRAFLGITT
jgi:hypothetical protein